MALARVPSAVRCGMKVNRAAVVGGTTVIPSNMLFALLPVALRMAS